MSRMIRVGVGEFRIGRAPDVLITHSLGPCIGITAYDPQLKVGGMIHFMLPDSRLHPARASRKPAVFADTGIVRLMAALEEQGARASRLIVTMAGGASILDRAEVFGIGRKNIEAARTLLDRMGLAVTEGPVGGTHSRTLTLRLEDGKVDVRSCRTGPAASAPEEDDTDLNLVTFHRLAGIIYRSTGIRLPLRKRPLVKTRLARRMRALGIRSFPEYVQRIESPACGEERDHLFNAISTNQTAFFREMDHFRRLARDVLPAVEQARRARGDRKLRLWSAGCASGEEAYSMAMVVDRFVRGTGPAPGRPALDFRILATDLNTDMVQRAADARYDLDAVAPVPGGLKRAYLVAAPSIPDAPRCVTVHAELRRRVAVGRLNLMASEFPFQGPFDVIFLRNVLMYFSAAARTTLLERLQRYLAPWGYLFLGSAEAMHHPEVPFVPLGNSIYQRHEAATGCVRGG